MIKKRGITLIEALFVLGVLAIIIGMVMLLFAQNNASVSANQLKSECMKLRDITLQLYSSLPANLAIGGGTDAENDPSAISNGSISNILASSGLIEQKYIKNSTIVGPNGELIDVYTHVANKLVAIRIANMNYSQCVRITTMDWGGTNTDVKLNGYDISANMFTPILAETQCTKNTNNGFVINWAD